MPLLPIFGGQNVYFDEPVLLVHIYICDLQHNIHCHLTCGFRFYLDGCWVFVNIITFVAEGVPFLRIPRPQYP